jgi:hypothetical protein
MREGPVRGGPKRGTAFRGGRTGTLGVAEARIEIAGCEAGKLILYVGIDEKGASTAHWSAEPQGTERLPEETLRTSARSSTIWWRPPWIRPRMSGTTRLERSG